MGCAMDAINQRARVSRARPGRLLALTIAVVGLMVGTHAASAATVVTDQVIGLAAKAQVEVPVTFGQVFKDGDVPKGATVVATVAGAPVTLQVDPKATNPDGSLRHAVLTLRIPELGRKAKLPVALSTAATAPMAGAPVTLAALLTTAYDAKAVFQLGGQAYTVEARPLLQAAAKGAACKPWNTQCNQWLSGPLASEWVVHGQAMSSGGTAAPGLEVYFAVRAYSNGAGGVGQVRTDIIVENSNAFAPQVQPQYTATLTSGSASYTSPALTQYTATRWHQVLWWNASNPQVYLQQNIPYIEDTKAISRYMSLTPDASFLASLAQSCVPLDHCGQTPQMGNTGAQPSIGPLPRWTSVYVVDPDVRAYNWMLANTDALGAYSVHYRDAATGWPLSIQQHPNVTITAYNYAQGVAAGMGATAAAYAKDLLPTCVNNAVVTGCKPNSYRTGSPYEWDNAHQPDMSYVPYMVTGSYYYMSELAFSGSINELYSNMAYRGYSKGLIDEAYGQVRGKAWVLRNMVNAAWLLPDQYPLKAEFNASVNNAIQDFNTKYTDNPNASPLGLLMTYGALAYNIDGGQGNGMAPWQHDFLTWSAGHAADLGFAGAAAFRNWLARFEIGLMTDWQSHPNGYCWLQASAYKLIVKDADGTWLPSFTAIYAKNFPTLVGLGCNTPTMVAAMGKLEGQPWQAGEMPGYPYASTGFPANFQIGVATAADSGLPGAQDAWSLFDSRSIRPDGTHSNDPTNAYRNYPNFAVIPRTVTAGVVKANQKR